MSTQETALVAAPVSNALTFTQDGHLDIVSIGTIIAQSGYFDKVKSRSQAIVKVLVGRELGISDMTAVMNINIIEGKPSLSAQLIAAKVKSSGRYKYRVTELDEKHCVIKWWTRDTPTSDWETLADSSFSIEEATTAKLNKEDSNWRKWPKNMCMWRALVLGQRMHAPEVTLGCAYLPEELGQAMDENGTAIDVTPEPTPTPAEPSRPSVLSKVVGQAAPAAAPVVETVKAATAVTPAAPLTDENIPI